MERPVVTSLCFTFSVLVRFLPFKHLLLNYFGELKALLHMNGFVLFCQIIKKQFLKLC